MYYLCRYERPEYPYIMFQAEDKKTVEEYWEDYKKFHGKWHYFDLAEQGLAGIDYFIISEEGFARRFC